LQTKHSLPKKNPTDELLIPNMRDPVISIDNVPLSANSNGGFSEYEGRNRSLLNSSSGITVAGANQSTEQIPHRFLAPSISTERPSKKKRLLVLSNPPDTEKRK